MYNDYAYVETDRLNIDETFKTSVFNKTNEIKTK